jgi:glycosyltransferase involved in cell wall biosynthesis
MHEYMRWPYGKCTRILVPSAATGEMLSQGKLDPAKIRIWRRGVSADRFSPDRRSPEWRDRWGASDARPVLLYVGRLSREKGVDLLPALTERLQRSGFRHRLVIVGDGPMREELSNRCTGAIFTGSLLHDEVATVMASADLFVFPSRTDTAGNVVLEAQASGLPVLVTEAGGPAENMIDGVTGFVCHDVRAFARWTTTLMNAPCRRRQVAAEARRYAEQRNWTSALDPLYRTYREAVTANRAGAPVGIGSVFASEPAS